MVGVVWSVYVVVSAICITTCKAKVHVYNWDNQGDSGDLSEFILVQRRATEDSADSTLNTTKQRTFSATISRRHGITVLKRFNIGHWNAVMVRLDREQVRSMEEDSDLEYMEANIQVQAFAKQKANSKTLYHVNDIIKNSVEPSNKNETETPLFCFEQTPGSSLWHLSRVSSHGKPDYADDPYHFTNVDMGSGVDLYIVDTGIRATHIELRGRATLGFKASDIDEPLDDMNGHGTNVASLAAGHTVGTAKEAHVVSVKVLDKDGVGLVSWILEGIEWITEQIKAKRKQGGLPKAIINLSLGTNGISYALDDAIQAVVQNVGISVVVAAGNDHADACFASPGRLSSVITVAASTARDTLASFSNYGPCVDLLAPGQDVIGAWALGDDVYADVSGTSQAAPLVTGVLARYLSSLDEEEVPSPNFLKAYIMDTSSRGYIALSGPEERSTPNRLVYRGCESLGSDLPSYRPPYPNYPGISGGVSRTYFNIFYIFVCYAIIYV